MVELSIVVPTLNEEQTLPLLLEDLCKSNLKDYEVIVSDSQSSDNTLTLAKSFANQLNIKTTSARRGAAHSRNDGVKRAVGSTILFLDADQRATPEFVNKSLTEFKRRNLDIACFYARPINGNWYDQLFWWFCNNILFRPGQYIKPSGSTGSGLLIKRALHNKIHGFDETIHVIHDHDYVARASKRRRFRMINSVRSTYCMRRFAKEGRFVMTMKYIWLTLYFFLGIKSTPFEYKFGDHGGKND